MLAGENLREAFQQADSSEFIGDVADGKMIVNDVGKIAEQCWKEIPNHFPYASLDEFIIMPDHVNGIIVLGVDDPITNVETPKLGVSTEKTTIKRATIGTIINQFKRICTITIRKQNPDFAWQSRFYDHIIWNDDELGHIREYILCNPQNWQKDAYTEEMIEAVIE